MVDVPAARQGAEPAAPAGSPARHPGEASVDGCPAACSGSRRAGGAHAQPVIRRQNGSASTSEPSTCGSTRVPPTSAMRPPGRQLVPRPTDAGNDRASSIRTSPPRSSARHAMRAAVNQLAQRLADAEHALERDRLDDARRAITPAAAGGPGSSCRARGRRPDELSAGPLARGGQAARSGPGPQAPRRSPARAR